MAIVQLAFLTTPLVGILLLTHVSIGEKRASPNHPTLIYCYILAFQILLASMWRVFIKPLLFSQYKDIPEPSGGSFINGHFGYIMSMGNGEAELRWLEKIPNNGMLRCRGLLNVERIIVTSPTALAKIATDTFIFVKPNILRLLAGRVLGLGLVLVNRDVHKQQRKLFLPPFAPKHIHDLTPTFWRKSREVTEKMCIEIRGDTNSSRAVLEIGEWAARVALDIITLTGMGKDFGAVQNQNAPLATVYMKVLEPTLGHVVVAILKGLFPARLVEALPIKSNHDQANAMHTIRGVCRRLLQEKKEKKSDSKDILNVCLKYGEIAGVNEEEVIDQMTTFLGAGHETISVGITWAVYMFSIHQEWQQKIRAEIRSTMPALDHPMMERTRVETLPLLRAFIEEVLRWYPPIPTTMREPFADTELDGHLIAKGTRIIVPIKAINREEKFWGPDSREFKPERWLKDSNTFDSTGGVTTKYGHLSFMQGPRSCIAAGFARAEMVCILAVWVARFGFDLADERFRDEKNMETSGGNLSAKPLHGMRVQVRLLDGW
ncbi:cytochrome P450 [Ophiobolus disseminans]|uniref:Cytochrome P450 n=1 Tax=Ophiobolus disseminans TaxID=1469910 RepID=A0A6A6ZG90_9PLEO|nr:cytochrome P450 [Ophiobolus disseminans]